MGVSRAGSCRTFGAVAMIGSFLPALTLGPRAACGGAITWADAAIRLGAVW